MKADYNSRLAAAQKQAGVPEGKWWNLVFRQALAEYDLRIGRPDEDDAGEGEACAGAPTPQPGGYAWPKDSIIVDTGVLRG